MFSLKAFLFGIPPSKSGVRSDTYDVKIDKAEVCDCVPEPGYVQKGPAMILGSRPSMVQAVRSPDVVPTPKDPSGMSVRRRFSINAQLPPPGPEPVSTASDDPPTAKQQTLTKPVYVPHRFAFFPFSDSA